MLNEYDFMFILTLNIQEYITVTDVKILTLTSTYLEGEICVTKFRVENTMVEPKERSVSARATRLYLTLHLNC